MLWFNFILGLNFFLFCFKLKNKTKENLNHKDKINPQHIYEIRARTQRKLRINLKSNLTGNMYVVVQFHIVEALLTDTLVSGQLYLRPP